MPQCVANLIADRAGFTTYQIFAYAVTEWQDCLLCTKATLLTLEYSYVGIVPDDAASRLDLPGISRFPILVFDAVPFAPHFTLISSLDFVLEPPKSTQLVFFVFWNNDLVWFFAIPNNEVEKHSNTELKIVSYIKSKSTSMNSLDHNQTAPTSRGAVWGAGCSGFESRQVEKGKHFRLRKDLAVVDTGRFMTIESKCLIVGCSLIIDTDFADVDLLLRSVRRTKSNYTKKVNCRRVRRTKSNYTRVRRTQSVRPRQEIRTSCPFVEKTPAAAAALTSSKRDVTNLRWQRIIAYSSNTAYVTSLKYPGTTGLVSVVGQLLGSRLREGGGRQPRQERLTLRAGVRTACRHGWPTFCGLFASDLRFLRHFDITTSCIRSTCTSHTHLENTVTRLLRIQMHRTHQQNDVSGQQHIEELFANERVVSYLLASNKANREYLVAGGSQWPVLRRMGKYTKLKWCGGSFDGDMRLWHVPCETARYFEEFAKEVVNRLEEFEMCLLMNPLEEETENSNNTYEDPPMNKELMKWSNKDEGEIPGKRTRNYAELSMETEHDLDKIHELRTNNYRGRWIGNMRRLFALSPLDEIKEQKKEGKLTAKEKEYSYTPKLHRKGTVVIYMQLRHVDLRLKGSSEPQLGSAWSQTTKVIYSGMCAQIKRRLGEYAHIYFAEVHGEFNASCISKWPLPSLSQDGWKKLEKETSSARYRGDQVPILDVYLLLLFWSAIWKAALTNKIVELSNKMTATTPAILEVMLTRKMVVALSRKVADNALPSKMVALQSEMTELASNTAVNALPSKTVANALPRKMAANALHSKMAANTLTITILLARVRDRSGNIDFHTACRDSSGPLAVFDGDGFTYDGSIMTMAPFVRSGTGALSECLAAVHALTFRRTTDITFALLGMPIQNIAAGKHYITVITVECLVGGSIMTMAPFVRSGTGALSECLAAVHALTFRRTTDITFALLGMPIQNIAAGGSIMTMAPFVRSGTGALSECLAAVHALTFRRTTDITFALLGMPIQNIAAGKHYITVITVECLVGGSIMTMAPFVRSGTGALSECLAAVHALTFRRTTDITFALLGMPIQNIAAGKHYITVITVECLVKWAEHAIATFMSLCSTTFIIGISTSNIDTLMIAMILRDPFI
ncbi:hypothetical protein PR048_018715 [Dryococelus australis]|uniref:Uncharacterized protein n=1 Tax=Dryococelus australis TaxID=614101 RepID=A0ABQ9HD14_9NEOP|nr:hypothetical protein PR048_018715 [Dryococelus australis]